MKNIKNKCIYTIIISLLTVSLWFASQPSFDSNAECTIEWKILWKVFMDDAINSCLENDSCGIDYDMFISAHYKLNVLVESLSCDWDTWVTEYSELFTIWEESELILPENIFNNVNSINVWDNIHGMVTWESGNKFITYESLSSAWTTDSNENGQIEVAQLTESNEEDIATINQQYLSAEKLAEKSIIKKQETEVLYNLGWKITRKEIMKVVINLSWKEVEDNCESAFSDVANDWWCKYIEWALEYWFVAHNETFRPGDSITKAEALKLIFKAEVLEKKYDTLDWWNDYMLSALEYWMIDEKYSDHNSYATRWWIFMLATSVK